jgi:hypothetical protein
MLWHSQPRLYCQREEWQLPLRPLQQTRTDWSLGSVPCSGHGVPLSIPHFVLLVPAFVVWLLSTSHYQIFPNPVLTGFEFKFSVPMVTHLPVKLDARVKYYLQNHLESTGRGPSPLLTCSK